jgi:hypothetical protein
MKNFYEYLYFTIYKVIYIIYLYFYRCKIVELLFRVLRRFATLLNDLSLILSFLSSFSAFMCVLEVYFKVTLKCDQDRTERIVAAATTTVVEIEHACIRTIIVIASAYEERIARVRKVRVNAVPRTTA